MGSMVELKADYNPELYVKFYMFFIHFHGFPLGPLLSPSP